MGFAKKLRREAFKAKKTELEDSVGAKMNMFDRMPHSCNICGKPFSNKNKEQVLTWTVVVRGERKTVSLFCPTCLAEIKGEIEPYLTGATGAVLTEDGKLEIKTEPVEEVPVEVA